MKEPSQRSPLDLINGEYLAMSHSGVYVFPPFGALQTSLEKKQEKAWSPLLGSANRHGIALANAEDGSGLWNTERHCENDKGRERRSVIWTSPMRHDLQNHLKMLWLAQEAPLEEYEGAFRFIRHLRAFYDQRHRNSLDKKRRRGSGQDGSKPTKE